MDPLTALSVAGTIVQLVDFGTKILRGSFSVYRSASGALPVNDELEIITRDLTVLATKLRRPLYAEDVPTIELHSIQDRALRDLCDNCARVADKLLDRLNGLRVQGRHQMWRSLQHAIRTAWAQNEVDELTTTLSRYRTSIQTHILSSIRYAIAWLVKSLLIGNTLGTALTWRLCKIQIDSMI
jgi:hypothetical protein